MSRARKSDAVVAPTRRKSSRGKGAGIVRLPMENESRAKLIRSIRSRYSRQLQVYVAAPDEAALMEIYRLGRDAVLHEVSLLDMLDMHNFAVTDAIGALDGKYEMRDILKAGSIALSEFLSPMGMSIRGYREVSMAMCHLNETLEDEIKRIAHDIHVGAGQYLACAHVSLYELAKLAGPAGEAKLKEAKAVLDELERHLRQVSHELRPRVLEEVGIASAIELIVETFCQRTEARVETAVELTARPPAVVEAALYRCVQEIFNNITKHARANKVSIRLWDDEHWFQCDIKDDGVGFNADEMLLQRGGRHLGLLVIRERVSVLGGDVEIDSTPGQGARFLLRIPK